MIIVFVAAILLMIIAIIFFIIAAPVLKADHLREACESFFIHSSLKQVNEFSIYF
jgi:hypothetical protein